MAITNEASIKFSNEQIRPMAEKLRALKVDMESLLVDWHNGIKDDIPNEVDNMLEDGRDLEGINKLDGADINSFITTLSSINTNMTGATTTNVIAKPCVRPLRSS